MSIRSRCSASWASMRRTRRRFRELQPKLDEWLARHPEAQLDYIHGAEECRKLGDRPDRLSIVFGGFDRGDFFATIQRDGIFVRKSFSIGSADEKRYYLECRRIR